MIKRLLLFASTICTVVVVLSFGLFAADQAGAGSAVQQDKLASVDQSGSARQSESDHGKLRRAIDHASNKLTSPFDGVAKSSTNIWVKRSVPAILAVLCYFVLLRVLAGYTVRLKT